MNTPTKKILIIDDDERNIFALKAVLTAKKFNCVVAPGGLQALEILKQHRDISVALVDMMMPDMDGYELMTLIRKIPSLNSLQLVALTAQAMMGDKEKCLAAGADDYISKPVDIDVLLQILDGRLKQVQ
jgi:two-component system, cell cycle response regulator DivK